MRRLLRMRRALAFLVLFAPFGCRAALASGFTITVLGAGGGVTGGNLSAYMIRPRGDARAVLCDAGTLVDGLEAVDRAGGLRELAVPPGDALFRAAYVATHSIKAVLISHAHLDHVAGLALFSPEDRSRAIYALPSVNAAMAQSLFNGVLWPNMGDRGAAPVLGRYRYVDLARGVTTPLPETALSVTPYPLSHSGVTSTAFLLQGPDAALLYLGDTGADPVEHSDALGRLWAAIAPLLRAGRLRTIIIESSYDDSRPDSALYGHLKPHWLLAELHALRDSVGGRDALRGLTVVVSHIKPVISATRSDPGVRIMAQIAAGNDLGVHLVRPVQGETIEVP